jgi:hypothetical protein
MLKRIAVSIAMALCFTSLSYAQPESTAHPPDTAAIPKPEMPPADPKPILPANCTNCAAPAACGDCRCWASADYIFAWMRPASLPPLVTTSPSGTAQTAAGVLGADNTAVVFGNSNVNGEFRSGFRLDFGGWLDGNHTIGLDASFFLLESQADLFFANSPTGDPILARPFTNATNSAPTSQLVSFPGVGTGSINASYRTDNLFGVTLDVQECLPLCCWGVRLIPMFGYRYLQFNDRLAVDTNETAAAGGPIVEGTQIVVSDRFSVVNVFHGGEIGLRTEYASNSWSVALLTKLAVGSIHHTVGIQGTTQNTVPGETPANFNGGFLALSSNTGTFNSNEWGVVPEFGVTFGWNVTCNMQVRLGYSFLLWSDVVRSADQVDLTINPNLFPPPTGTTTPSRPAFQQKTSDIWVQSLTLGMEYRF